jgi:hypothetical protein
MRRTLTFLPVVLLALSATPPRAQQPAGTPFVGPERLFSVRLPAGWSARTEASPEGPITWLTGENAVVSVMAARVPAPRRDPRLLDRLLADGGQVYFQGWLGALRGIGRVQARPVTRTRVFGYPALRLDVTYRRGDARDPRTGYALYALGDNTSYFITASAPARSFPAADRVVTALRPGGGR